MLSVKHLFFDFTFLQIVLQGDKIFKDTVLHSAKVPVAALNRWRLV